ncbi:hypothetical protein NZD89_01180 [Alicyclobacillus fastidiosus]|uniref:Uncharacterized protein n=1 Tax=Alicyclobacillus fastidiosus TaxID=392011 RepID=A0ABY6ZH30_9BACL|nr:hypothetical protein [Alicyclobacillus fastidiosus]WAH42159.1 hypothetical protein NZD89_01180 [Alicyclobacillus fastidiosus]GMA63951.1 hypothetical protein GCM10025859_43910 [Alicyclobacillus fastidiosus]
MHTHWEYDSICPHCGRTNHVKAPAGEHVVRVCCTHCAHGYEYTHVVQQFSEVVDSDEENT